MSMRRLSLMTVISAARSKSAGLLPAVPDNARRSIVEFKDPQSQKAVENLSKNEKNGEFFREHFDNLRYSPRIYTFQTASLGENQEFRASDRSVRVRPDDVEGLAHETTHAAQFESIANKHGTETAENVFDDPHHKMVLEGAALLAGLFAKGGDKSKAREEALTKWRGYENETVQKNYNYSGTVEDALKTLKTHRYHAFSAELFDFKRRD